jgi:GntR family transcriptional regulator, transcriptional repressor for pyruvate dehydrogenase complex
MALTDEAIERIKEMIVKGELRPGDRLPKEVDLAERLGLSRNSLREAVKALSLIRVLDVRQGDGTYVTSLDPELLLETMAFVVDLHSDAGVLEFFELHRVLEPAATALAAQRMSEDEVFALRQVLDDLGPEPSIDRLMAGDVEFHRLIAVGSGNASLASLLDSVRRSTYRARIWRGLTQGGAVHRTVAEHRAIMEAIAVRDPDLARSWATVHVAGVERWIRDFGPGI